MKVKTGKKNVCAQYLWLGVYCKSTGKMWHRQRLGKKASQRTGTTTLLFTLEPELPLLIPLNFSKGRRHWDVLATIKGLQCPPLDRASTKHSQRHFSSLASNQNVVPGAAARGQSSVGYGQSEGQADFPPGHLEGVKATYMEKSVVWLTLPHRWPWTFFGWVLWHLNDKQDFEFHPVIGSR